MTPTTIFNYLYIKTNVYQNNVTTPIKIKNLTVLLGNFEISTASYGLEFIHFNFSLFSNFTHASITNHIHIEGLL